MLHFGCNSKAAMRSLVHEVTEACLSPSLLLPNKGYPDASGCGTIQRLHLPDLDSVVMVPIECRNGMFGLQLGPNNIITAIMPNGPATNKLRPGDQLLSVDEQWLGDQRLQDVLRLTQPAQTRTFQVHRSNRRADVVPFSQWL